MVEKAQDDSIGLIGSGDDALCRSASTVPSPSCEIAMQIEVVFAIQTRLQTVCVKNFTGRSLAGF